MEHGVYVVSVGTLNSGILWNKRNAIRLARKSSGTVYRIPVALYRDGGPFGWDYRTFKIYADVVADFAS